MKSRTVTCITAVTLFAALAIPVRLAAQDNRDHHHKHHHYRLIDMGTFGGPISAINFATDINNNAASRRGGVVGYSATSAPKLSTSQPLICGGDDGFGANITHAFQWRIEGLIDLGALAPTDINCSNAYQVNSHGEVAGFSENGEFDPQIGWNQSRAVRWKNGEIEELGGFGGNQGEALAINNRGQIAGFYLTTVPHPFSLYDSIFGAANGTQTRAFLWQDKEMQDIGTLGGNDAGAFYINDRGQIAGFSHTSPTPDPVTGLPPLDPFLWDNGKMIDLGTLGGVLGLFTGFGGGLNNRGQVIGSSSIAADPGACLNPETNPNCHPFLWDSGKMFDLATTTDGASPISADGINDKGEIAGAADFSAAGGSTFGAYLWRNGTAFNLGTVNEDCFSRALAINNRPQIVGNSFFCNFAFDHGFLWEHGSIVDLNALIPTGSSLTLVATNDINDRGEIAGEGLPAGCSDGTACGHAFLLIPCDENHPGVEGCDYDTAEAPTAVTKPETTDIGNAIRQAPRQGLRTHPHIPASSGNDSKPIGRSPVSAVDDGTAGYLKDRLDGFALSGVGRARRCTPRGRQCPPQFPPCCPGLDLGTLGGPDSFAQFVNNRGQVAGFSYTDSTVNATTGVP